MAQPFTLIDEDRIRPISARLEGDRLQVAPPDLASALGWDLAPEGLCKGGVCVPLRALSAPGNEAEIDLEAFADRIERPLVFEAAERLAVLGGSAAERRRVLASGQAPDFELPDLAGRLHSLAAHRGKKVLLIAYASW